MGDRHWSQFRNWEANTKELAKDVSNAKQKLLTNELNLRLHMLSPRGSRLERDIKEIRALELSVHRRTHERLQEAAQQRFTSMKDAGREVLCQFAVQSKSLRSVLMMMAKAIHEPKRQRSKDYDGVKEFALHVPPTISSMAISKVQQEAESELEKLLHLARSVIASVREKITHDSDEVRALLNDMESICIPFANGGDYADREMELYGLKAKSLRDKYESLSHELHKILESALEELVNDAKHQTLAFVEHARNRSVETKFCEDTAKHLNAYHTTLRAEVWLIA